jgi:hypothetical protein
VRSSRRTKLLRKLSLRNLLHRDPPRSHFSLELEQKIFYVLVFHPETRAVYLVERYESGELAEARRDELSPGRGQDARVAVFAGRPSDEGPFANVETDLEAADRLLALILSERNGS